jgi:uncharacterized protein YjcR
MKRNQAELMDLMYFNKLKAHDVAKILKCHSNTVRVWRCNSGVAMPDAKLELLQLKLKEQKNG